MFMFSRRSCHWKVWTMPQPWRVWFDQLIWNKDTLKCLNSLERLVWSADTEYNQPIECLNSSESLVWSADAEYIINLLSVCIVQRVWFDEMIRNKVNLKSLNSSESIVWSADMEYNQPKGSEQFRESCVISWNEKNQTKFSEQFRKNLHKSEPGNSVTKHWSAQCVWGKREEGEYYASIGWLSQSVNSARSSWSSIWFCPECSSTLIIIPVCATCNIDYSVLLT